MSLLFGLDKKSFAAGSQSLTSSALSLGVLPGLLPWTSNRTIGASAQVVGTVRGLAHRSASTADGIVKCPIQSLGTATGQYVGLLTTFRTTTTTANAVVGALGSDAGSSGNTLCNVYLTGASNANVTFVFGGSGSNQTFETTGVNLNDGVVHSVLAICGPWTAGGTTVIADVYIDGRRASSSSFAAYATGLSNAYTWAIAGGFRRGGVDGVYTSQGDVDTLAVLPILRHSRLDEADGLALTRAPYSLFAPRRIWVPVSAGGGGSHDATGAMSAQSAAVSGSAAAVATYTSSGALTAQAATVAGSATHTVTHASSGVLEAQAATVSGSADHSAAGAFSATGVLTAQVATVAGSAAHLTLHTATGALVADSATAAGSAVHYTLHAATGDLVADAASVGGAALHSGDGAEVAKPFAGAGRPRRTRQRVVVEIDGEDFIAESVEEARELLDKAKDAAEEKASIAVKRATEAKKRPARKIVADARKELALPTINAPGLEDYAGKIAQQIEDLYRSTIRTIEVESLLRNRDRAEEDDEDILLLIA